MLIDPSVWSNHFRHRSDRLSGYLESGEAWTHPFIIGELACGALTRRGGRGLGWMDMQLLASAYRAGFSLWTRDRLSDFRALAREMRLASRNNAGRNVMAWFGSIN